VAAIRTRSENLHSVYVLLFLNIAFFFLEHQDAEKYARVFSFDWTATRGGEVWRLITWQFTQAGQGWFAFPKPVILFFTLLLLYLMGSAVEEVWGSRHFLSLFLLSTLISAVTAAYFGVVLLGSYFVNFSLLFVYAATFPQQTFYLFGMMPVRIRWIAWVAALVLISGVIAGGAANAAALAGAAVSLGYYLAMKGPIVEVSVVSEPAPASKADTAAVRNAARFVGIRKALAAGKAAEIDRLSDQFRREVVGGVNICPPVDYKPEHNDGYCIRCDGFAECSVRYLAINRPDR
jgi:membrane associated rhomboid family serine protease